VSRLAPALIGAYGCRAHAGRSAHSRGSLLHVTFVVALLMPAVQPARGQDSVRVDDRVRIWPSTDHRYAARVLSSWYPDSLRVLRSDSSWRPARTRTNTVALPTLTRLDLARGNQWKRGVLGGLVAAVGVGILIGATQDWEGVGPTAGAVTTVFAAVLTVPVGALIGSFYPQWHRMR
jgi:hypothetical protein